MIDQDPFAELRYAYLLLLSWSARATLRTLPFILHRTRRATMAQRSSVECSNGAIDRKGDAIPGQKNSVVALEILPHRWKAKSKFYLLRNGRCGRGYRIEELRCGSRELEPTG